MLQDKDKELAKRMRAAKIFKRDIEESFVLSSGPGGQNVNKVSTCVFLKHIPTDIKVKCQKYRTQIANRYYARLLLVEKIEQQKEKRDRSVIALKEKKRRENRKRPKFLKERILEQKKRRSKIKTSRKKIDIKKADSL
ncbi:MAG: peptide chain release factor-like protein [Candidatus Zapsychrus exili]|nr:peptide chain release factor-like protein [Candidatus Zapsychrus exili]